MKHKHFCTAAVAVLCAAALSAGSLTTAFAQQGDSSAPSAVSSAPGAAGDAGGNALSAPGTSSAAGGDSSEAGLPLSGGASSTPEKDPASTPAKTPTVDRDALTFSEAGQEQVLVIQMDEDGGKPSAVCADPSVAAAGEPVWSAQRGGYTVTVTARAAGETSLSVNAGGTVLSVPVKVEAEPPADRAPAVDLWMDTTATYTFQSVGKQYCMLVRTNPITVPVLKSGDPSVVRVGTPEWNEASNGYLCRIYSEGEGSTQITVQAGGAVKTLPVRVALPQTTLWRDTYSYQFGSAGQRYTALFRTNPDTRPAVTSSDPSVVSVAKPVWNASARGYLCTFTAGAEGDAAITVKAGNAVSTIPITVQYVAVGIMRDTYSYTFQTVGQAYTALVRTTPNHLPVFSTSNASVVTVGAVRWDAGAKGYLCTMTARGEGSAAVSITAGKTTVTIPIRVTLAPASVWIDTTMPYRYFYPNQRYTMLARVSGNAPVVIYSTDPSVVSVSVRKGGKPGEYLIDTCAKQNGRAQVVVSCGKGKSVMPAEVAMIPISITSDTVTAVIPEVGRTYTALVRTTRDIRPTAVSSNSSVVRVEKIWWDASAKGYLCQARGLRAGSATITLEAGGARRSYTVTVRNPVPSAQRAMQQKAQSYSSRTGYLILVNNTTRQIGIFTGGKGNWSMRSYWRCSVGKSSTPTVTGEFATQDKGYYFDSGSARCFYWTRFYGGYLFHSTLYYQNNSFIPMDSTLGAAISHGCVRLQLSNAKWIYDNIPYGTKVVSYR